MLKITIILLTIFSFFIKPIFAQSDFIVDANVEYKVSESGTTAVTHTITIKNNSSYEYAKSYYFELSNLEALNIKAFEEGSEIPIQLNKEGTKQIINLEFLTPLAGKNKSRTFIITYEEPKLATKNGEVWEVTIPKLLSQYNSYKVTMSVPLSFGQEALIYPDAIDKKENQQRLIYIFDGKDLDKSGVNAVFGKFQVYSINLTYHLKNNEDKNNIQKIAIPPDTSTQKMYYTKITPVPINVELDDDGNWLASFNLQPKDNKDVIVEGYAQIFANPVKILAPYPSTILANLKPLEYWESDDPNIKELALHLKTPQAIYNFVTDNLTYNYDRVNPDVERLGAKRALSQTSDAICTEYTDLFITLSRAAGIPAREINGYAYSDNSDLQPLSLVSDVLHSWPEYWDETRQNWIPVDPTWGSTSGIDYFNKFDLKHIAFVIHGKSSTQPLSAGSYKSDNLSKDIFIEFSSLPSVKFHSIDISHKVINKINLFNKRFMVNVKNNGVSAQYNLSTRLMVNGSESIKENISVLPPFATYSTYVDLDLGLFAIKSPRVVNVSVDHNQKEIILDKNSFVIQQLLFFFSILLICLFYIGIRTNKIHPKNFIANIKLLFRNASKS